jgi:hypothetical protein
MLCSQKAPYKYVMSSSLVAKEGSGNFHRHSCRDGEAPFLSTDVRSLVFISEHDCRAAQSDALPLLDKETGLIDWVRGLLSPYVLVGSESDLEDERQWMPRAASCLRAAASRAPSCYFARHFTPSSIRLDLARYLLEIGDGPNRLSAMQLLLTEMEHRVTVAHYAGECEGALRNSQLKLKDMLAGDNVRRSLGTALVLALRVLFGPLYD